MHIRIIRYFQPLALAAVLACLVPSTGAAEVVTFKRSYEHTAGRLDTELSSAIIARENVKALIFAEIVGRIKQDFGLRGLKAESAVAIVSGLAYVEVGGRGWDSRKYNFEGTATVDMEAFVREVNTVRNELEQVEDLARNRRWAQEALVSVGELAGASDSSLTAYDAAVRRLAATDWFERGHAAQHKGAYTASRDAFSRAVELNPRHEMAYFNRGVSNWYLENYREALCDFKTATEINPSYGRAFASLENAKRYMQRFESSVRYLDRLIKNEPDNPNNYLQRGLANWELGEYEVAVVDFSKLITLVPNAEDGYVNRGGVLMTMGKLEAAEQDFITAGKIAPGNTQVHFNIGLLRVKQGRLEEALASFGRVIELDSEDSEARFNRGLIYAETGKAGEAMADMEAAAHRGHPGAQAFLVEQGIPAPEAKPLAKAQPEPVAKAEPEQPEPAARKEPEPPKKKTKRIAGKKLPRNGPVIVDAPEEAVKEAPAEAEPEAPEPVAKAEPTEPKPTAEPEQAVEPVKPEPAAEAISNKAAAVEPKKAEPLKEAPEEPEPEKAKPGIPKSEGQYVVQAGAFSNKKNALARVTLFKKLGYESFIKEAKRGGRTVNLVIVHRFKDKAAASRLVDKIKKEHEIKSFVTVIK